MTIVIIAIYLLITKNIHTNFIDTSDPSFWINSLQTPDKIILDQKEIDSLNISIIKKGFINDLLQIDTLDIGNVVIIKAK